MAGSVNKAIIIGHLGRDPEVRDFPSGGRIVTINVATSETWRDKATQERKERTEWHKVVIYDENLVKLASQYLKKGSKLYLEGQLETRSWDKDGQKHYATEIALRPFRSAMTLLDRRERSDDPSHSEDDIDRRGQGNATSNTDGGRDAMDDEIPF